MAKKNDRYRDPQMPESLYKLLTDDFSDDKEPRNLKRKPKKTKGKKKQRPSKNTRQNSKTPKRQDFEVARKKKKKDLEKNKKTNTNIKKKKPASQKVRPAGGSYQNKRKKSLGQVDEERRKNKKNVRKTVKNKSLEKRKSTRKRKKAVTIVNIKHILLSSLYSLLLLVTFIFTGGDRKKYISREKKKKLDFKFYKYLSLGTMAIIILVTLLFSVSPKLENSMAENRSLQQKPKFTIQSFVTGKYAKAYSKYLSDQFPARQKMIKEKAKFDLFLGRKEVNGVYICKDGYLMEGFTQASPEVTQSKVNAINEFASQNPKIKISMMLVPNKVEIYKNLLPKNAPVDSQKQYLDSLKKKLATRVKFVDLIENFDKMKNYTQLYYKTDHHWTTDGAYKAYEEFLRSKDMSPPSEKSFKRSLATNKFLGSLYYKNGAQIGKPEDIVMYLKDRPYPLIVKYYDTKKKKTTLYDAEKLKTKDKYEVFTGGNHTQIKIRTNVDNNKKLLIIKDSYANAMLPFLINNFAEINVVDLRYYTGTIDEIINNNEITDLLILYNVNTFNTDSSILNITDKKQISEEVIEK